MKYICTKEGWKHKVLSYNQVKECINTLHPGIILPVDIDKPDLLALFNIKKLKEIYKNTHVNNEGLEAYCDYIATGEPFQDSDGVWCIEWQHYINNMRLDDAWTRIKLERNKLLSATDWTEHSLVLTEECKYKHIIYRQLLRDCLHIVDYPHQVVFPIAPAIVYKSFYTRSNTPELIYDDTELECIKSYKPSDKESDNWNLFLKEWSKVNFTNNCQYVNNLISLYTNIDYETIF